MNCVPFAMFFFQVAAAKSLAEDAYYVVKGGAQSDSLVFSFKFT